MPNAKDITPDFRLFALFVGEYDTGKSTAAASFPGRKYFLDFDGRIVSLRGRSDVDFDFFTSTAMGFEEADKKVETLVAYGSQLPYQTIVFDSLSMARSFLLYDAMKYTSGVDEKGKVRGRQIGKLYLPTVQDYGYESEALKQLIWDGLKKLKSNVIVTGHLVDQYKTLEGKPGAPAERVVVGQKIYGDPQLLAVLPIAFTEIYHFSKEVGSDGKLRRFVTFTGEVARTTYMELANAGTVEITDKSFYEVWKSLIERK